MDIEQMLAKRLAETFTVEGFAPNVIEAHNIAWRNLENVLGDDALAAWALKGMQHVFTVIREQASVAFKAEFVRKPDED